MNTFRTSFHAKSKTVRDERQKFVHTRKTQAYTLPRRSIGAYANMLHGIVNSWRFQTAFYSEEAKSGLAALPPRRCRPLFHVFAKKASRLRDKFVDESEFWAKQRQIVTIIRRTPQSIRFFSGAMSKLKTSSSLTRFCKRESIASLRENREGLVSVAKYQDTCGTRWRHFHSHSIVAGGLLVMSYTTRLTPGISEVILFAMFCKTA